MTLKIWIVCLFYPGADASLRSGVTAYARAELGDRRMQEREV